MKTVITFFLSVILFFGGYSQDSARMKLVVTIDNMVPVNLFMCNLIVEGISGKDTLKCNYSPGELWILKAKELLKRNDTNKLYLNFTYYEYYTREPKAYTYRLPMNVGAISNWFNVFQIFNLDKKEYDGLFDRTIWKNYAYDYFSPAGNVHARR
jgi:hypothetical protein